MGRATILLLAFWLGGDGWLNEARRLTEAEQWSEALRAYEQAMDEYPALTAQISLNIGLVYLAMDSVSPAKEAFYQCLMPLAPQAAARALNHLGILALAESRPREALSNFREALLYDPAYEPARYNYELLARRLRKDQPPPNPNQPPPPDQQDDLPPPPADQPLDPEYEEILQKLMSRRQRVLPPGDQAVPLGNDTLTVAEARQVVELMRRQDRQYVQQLRKISSASAARENRNNW